MAITIKDVAKAAGVSVASVSRALNGHASVTPATRERIVGVAKRLRYIPHGTARSLITRRTHTVGALLPDLYGEFFSELIRGIDLAARAHGLHLLVSSSHGDAGEAAGALRAMQGRVDGLLVMSPYADADMLADNLSPALPTVLLNTRVPSARYAALHVDNHAGAFDMTRHLLDCGHRRIAMITGPQRNFDAEERQRGYRDALARHAPSIPPQVLPGDFTEDSGYRAGRAIAAMRPRPDAVFAANDMMAIGCLAAFSEAGLRVPEDIALAGFDDIPIARYLTPPLTTIRVPIADLGGQALRQLVAIVEDAGAGKPATRTLRPELIVRASSGASPHRGPRKRRRGAGSP